MKSSASHLKKEIRTWLVLFMVSLAISGLTAIPVLQEIDWLLGNFFNQSGTIANWLRQVSDNLHATPINIFYGFDWLAFAHLAIAVVFLGPFKDPVRNIWVIEFGMIACAMVLPFAMIMGEIREIPIWWRIVDCSFGVIGIIPLLIVRFKIKTLEAIIDKERLNTIF